ncbi:class E sortase [Streptomyces sp. ISL-36]|uniref:class E sortase n=1 Tax=Streptomyces sp. ISL-36 TaxID=2819182 RepID=UPI001BEBB578|nr:class E sortase [Streptomyces sp. ISL-36]MBT2442574.1 class E sortase [Streptomyces sp. ISL-36]
MPSARSVRSALAALGVLTVLVGCSAVTGGPGTAEVSTAVVGSASASLSEAPSPTPLPSSPTPLPPSAAPPAAAPAPDPEPSKRRLTAEVAIPSIDLTDLRVVPYEGTTDDRAGTRIQDRGVAASPYGERGGVGPGEIGNYLVTAHRLSAGGPLRDLPSVDVGDSVFVTAGDTVYEYKIVETRTTSFRSARSLAEQRAAVPGEPGEKPTRAMITLSTCATPEDDAAGNFWRDAQGNPEHRIDKIGVLSATRPS